MPRFVAQDFAPTLFGVVVARLWDTRSSVTAVDHHDNAIVSDRDPGPKHRWESQWDSQVFLFEVAAEEQKVRMISRQPTDPRVVEESSTLVTSDKERKTETEWGHGEWHRTPTVRPCTTTTVKRRTRVNRKPLDYCLLSMDPFLVYRTRLHPKFPYKDRKGTGRTLGFLNTYRSSILIFTDRSPRLHTNREWDTTGLEWGVFRVF